MQHYFCKECHKEFDYPVSLNRKGEQVLYQSSCCFASYWDSEDEMVDALATEYANTTFQDIGAWMAINRHSQQGEWVFDSIYQAYVDGYNYNSHNQG